MSVTRLLLSGLLVASGLILGAFTLHGYLDPRWPQRQSEAAPVRAPALKPWSTSTVRVRDDTAGANAEPQQASFQWPWGWLAD